MKLICHLPSPPPQSISPSHLHVSGTHQPVPRHRNWYSEHRMPRHPVSSERSGQWKSRSHTQLDGMHCSTVAHLVGFSHFPYKTNQHTWARGGGDGGGIPPCMWSNIM